MCDNDFVMCDVPKGAMDMIVTAWADFKANPSDGLKFRSLDWAIRVATAKWQSYADSRKANSA